MALTFDSLSCMTVPGSDEIPHVLFLPNLVDHTQILSPLTTNIAEKKFPEWMTAHQTAFNDIKDLVSKSACLTVIDHTNPGDNKIFLTCDASDFRTGAILSWGPTWETEKPVAYNLMQLTSTQLNYSVHEKELLAIIHGLKKWCSDLLGSHVEVFMDHRTLENFEGQKRPIPETSLLARSHVPV